MRCSVQTQRNNYPGQTAEEFWRRSIFLPFADQLISQLKARFNRLTVMAVSGLMRLPEKAIRPNCFVAETIKNFKDTFGKDLPAIDSLAQEIDRWVRRWKSVDHESLPKTLSKTYNSTEKGLYPNISCILHLLLVAPVTSASVEQANSALDYVKTDLRGTMGQERLNDLILLYVHKDIVLDYKKLLIAFLQNAHAGCYCKTH